MLDVHPPHNPTHTWRDFFIHIATIVIGLLIAIALEQSVEAIHHHYQRTELNEQMRVEAEHNLPIIRESLARLHQQLAYCKSLDAALSSGKVSGATVQVTGVSPYGGSAILISPSRGTWTTAQAAGLVALLPADQATLYARVDFNAEEEVRVEALMLASLEDFTAESRRAGYRHESPALASISPAHRDDLLFQLTHLENAISSLIVRLSLLEGGDEAIAAGKLSLADMYPYQDAALHQAHLNTAVGNFYGSQIGITYKPPVADQNAPAKP
jgi:hypothetical protein